MSHCTHSVCVHKFQNSNCSHKQHSSRDARHSTKIRNMDPLDEGKQTISKAIAATRKQIWRNARSECLSEGLKKVIAMLVLLGAQWECMAAVLTLKAGRLKRTRMAIESTTTDKLKEMAVQGFHKNPWLAQIVDNVEHAFHLQVKKLWLQWRTAQWLQVQNFKGVGVPSSMVWKHYRNMWGSGPHGLNVSNHLNAFDKKNGQRHWMGKFRRSWGFVYGKMPAKASMTAKEISKKVTNKKPFFS